MKKIEYKTCIKCGKTFPATTEYYYKHKTAKDGLMGVCKTCKNEYNKNNPNNKEHRKKYYEKNKEKTLDRCKEYREKNKEKIAAKRHEYYLKNKKRLDELNKENRIKNKDKHNEYSKKWAKNNLEKMRISNHKRRARIKKLSSTLTSRQWEQIKKSFNYECAYCGQVLPLEQEHFIPITKQGEYTHNNIIPACKSCNSSKCDKDFFEWYPRQEFYNTDKENKILKFLNYTKDGKQQLSFVMGL